MIVPQNKEDIADYCLYYGGTRQFKDLPEGNMDIHLVFGDTTSYSTAITLRKDGQSYLQLDSIGRNEDNKLAKTAFNLFQRNVSKTLAKNPYNIQEDDVIEVMSIPAGTFNQDNLLKGVITGTVTDNWDDSPLIGVSVAVKGKPIGTMTDLDGCFELKGASSGDKIEINYIGYKSTTFDYREGYNYDIALQVDARFLDEVVAVGYGTMRRSDLTGALSFSAANKLELEQVLQGRMAGVMVAGDAIRIRGVGSVESDAPLIIVNGLPFNGNLEDLDPSAITSLNVLKDANATAIYGSRGANGVIMIQTNAFGIGNVNKDENVLGAMEPAGNSMRRNFHDDAFWQPTLKTNAKGEVSFEVTYPDDVTSWNAYFLAIGNRKQTDKKQMTIQSFKALTARLATPRFAIRGDSLNAVGRIANYLNDSIEISQMVAVKGVQQEKTIQMTTSHVEQIPVTVSDGDSITLAYSLNMANGYFDGEERSIPIFEQGMLQTYGDFKIINDTVTTTFNVNPDLGTVTLYAEASSMEVFLREIDKIDRYPYYCNEQMASKLMALLAKKKAFVILGKEFKEDRKIRTLISRLKNNSNAEGLWGWWNKGQTEFWISKQTINAMLEAENAGFKTGTDTLKIRLVLERQLKNGLAKLPMMVPNDGSFAKQELLDRLVLLKQLNAPVDYPAYYEQINFHLKSNTVNTRLKEMLLLSELGMNEKINQDTLMRYSHKTMLGSMFWGDEKENSYSYRYCSPYINNIENTLMAYKILKNIGNHETELEKIRNYFFERRSSGSWQNTFEASRIIETIMLDMLSRDTIYSEISMSINDNKVSIFPYTGKIDVKQPIRIKKEGTLPLFVTVYQQEWNQNPQAESGKGFVVKTIFKENQDTISNLQAGKPVNLEIIVKVDADAEYVQIEVPIPAGCSYESKFGSFWGKEMHREHFKEKVSIFCNRLIAGEHRFTVELIPRFTGKYTLNPAKVELMYFPIFYGNEEVKSTEIY